MWDSYQLGQQQKAKEQHQLEQQQLEQQQLKQELEKQELEQLQLELTKYLEQPYIDIHPLTLSQKQDYTKRITEARLEVNRQNLNIFNAKKQLKYFDEIKPDYVGKQTKTPNGWYGWKDKSTVKSEHTFTKDGESKTFSFVFQIIDHEKEIVNIEKKTAVRKLEDAKQTEQNLVDRAHDDGMTNNHAARDINKMIKRFNLLHLPISGSDLEIIPDFKSLFSTGDLLQTYGSCLKGDRVNYISSDPKWFFIRGFDTSKNEIDLLDLNYKEYTDVGWGNIEKGPINLLECTYNIQNKQNVNTLEYTIIRLNAEGLKIILCCKEKPYSLKPSPSTIFTKTLIYNGPISGLLPMIGLTVNDISVIFSKRNLHSEAVKITKMYTELEKIKLEI